MLSREFILRICLLLAFSGVGTWSRAADFDRFVKPLIAQKCLKCHGGEEVNGKVDFNDVATAKQFLSRPDLIEEMIEVVDARDMPPQDEPELDEKTHTQLLAALKTMLREATTGEEIKRPRIWRLNRFQYNNTVKDLFQLKLNVFELPETMMTRYDNYLGRQSDHAAAGKMPDVVRVASHSLNPKAGLQDVKPYPKDLRAEHGFDNQANQLTLSPLLLDAFLRLSVSIVESPDFNDQNVGIWNDFFKEPAEGTDRSAEVTRRLEVFLKIAFRDPVDSDVLDRYAAYATSKMDQGLSFTESMKKVASAVLSSPMFLYRTASQDTKARQFELASNLSYFLWGSCPDLELLRLAESGELSRPEVLNETVERMMADPKIERFLDTFPVQWMQLENVLAATPDPQINKYFNLDKDHPASLQMVLEPLLLFDAVFVEDRPIVELIAPKFSYQSDFLQDWYTSDLTPLTVDASQVVEENRRNDQRRKSLEATIDRTRAELTAEQRAKQDALTRTLGQSTAALKQIPPNRDPVGLAEDAQRRFEDELRNKMRSQTFRRVAASDPRYGGVITNAAMLSMTSGPKRTHPVARGVWIAEVIFNDPPPPPPNNVPPLKEDATSKDLTIREQFAAHRNNPSCASCHARLDPLGFALENFDITGRWRDKYDNGRDVDSSGTVLRKYQFDGVIQFKDALVREDRRFAKAFTEHLLRFALSRELSPADSIAVDSIVNKTEKEEFKLKSLIREVALSDCFVQTK